MLELIRTLALRFLVPLTGRVAEGFDLSPPTRGDVVTLAISTTSAVFKVPKSWRGRYVAFTVLSTNGGIIFAPMRDGVTASLSAVSTILTNADYSINVGNGAYPLPENVEKVFGPFPAEGQGVDWCAIVGAASGTLYAAPASGRNQLRAATGDINGDVGGAGCA